MILQKISKKIEFSIFENYAIKGMVGSSYLSSSAMFYDLLIIFINLLLFKTKCLSFVYLRIKKEFSGGSNSVIDHEYMVIHFIEYYDFLLFMILIDFESLRAPSLSFCKTNLKLFFEEFILSL
ncbi:hypothetical protein BpHYR1_039690 [Brachionus plicatilis]|uniref:Uncharacterized protein n=1 Tax=Brachionus plicatilis TaxID=10195 RepID=A0A3M7QCQ6_BRAPC|nr:hypothetical protein BpHYR1_039690 [Brachionus plicatilis]